jgi:predicted nucleotidyltransferase
VDFLVEFKAESRLNPLDQFFGLADALKDLFGRPVDLVEASAVRNPFVRAAIDRSRELVYGA